MNAQELRIGNLVYDTRGHVDKVNIDAIKYLAHYPNTLCQIKPIPLTEEWLLKFGFGTRTTIGHSVQYFIGINPITHDWLFDILWLNGDSEPFYKNGFHKIKYVHQLQNLFFALTGEDLTLTQ